MGIDYSRFNNPDIQSKIKKALCDTKSPGKIDIAEFYALGLTKEEERELMSQLAGNPEMIGDGFFKKQTKSGSTILFSSNPRQGIIEISDSDIVRYRAKYPNVDIKEAFLKDGILFFKDSNGELIKNPDGTFLSEEVSVEEERLPFINPDGSVDHGKFYEYIKSLPSSSEDYTKLMRDIELFSEENAKISIERTTSIYKSRFKEVYNFLKRDEYTKAGEALYSYFQADCKSFDENVLSKIKQGLMTITGARFAGPVLYNILSYLSDDNNEATITKGERVLTAVANVDKGLEEFVFSTEGLLTMGAIAAGEGLLAKASSKLAPYIGGAIHSYFGAEGAELIYEGGKKVVSGETLEEIALGGQEIGHGLPMAGTIVRSGALLVGGLKTELHILNMKGYRSKILNSTSLEELEIIKETIKETRFTKQEKQALEVECLKRQIKIQGINKLIGNKGGSEASRNVIFNGEEGGKLESVQQIIMISENSIETGLSKTQKELFLQSDNIIEIANASESPCQTLNTLKYYVYKYENAAEIIEKLDVKKYKDVIANLIERMNYDSKKADSFFNPKNKKEDLNFILECIKSDKSENIIHDVSYLLKESQNLGNIGKQFVLKAIQNVNKNDIFNLGVFIKLGKYFEKFPEKLNKIEPYMQYISNYKISNSVIYALENCNDEKIFNFLMTQENIDFGNQYPVNHETGTIAIINNPLLLEEYKELKAFYPNFVFTDFNEILSVDHLERNFPKIKSLLLEKNDEGLPRYIKHDVINLFSSGIQAAEGRSYKIPIKDINLLGSIRDKNGKFAFDMRDIRYILDDEQGDLKALKENKPPEKHMDAYTLYERTFSLMQSEVQKYGCKTFKEFEELIPTLEGKEKAEAGKLLGKIKKQTIDTFLAGLPNKVIFLLSSGNGTFTAKDLDNAIIRINTSPVLRKYLNNIEKTGTIDWSQKIAKEYQSFSLDKNGNLNIKVDDVNFIDAFEFAQDRETASVVRNNEYYADNPLEAKKQYNIIKNLYEIFKAKLNLLIQSMMPEEFAPYKNNLDAYIEHEAYELSSSYQVNIYTKAVKFIGLSNLSAIIHNESAIKIEQIMLTLKRFEDLDQVWQDKISKILTNPSIKDNELKSLITIISTLNSSDSFAFVDIINKVSLQKTIDINSIYKDIFSLIKKQCGIETSTADIELDGWDIDYMPYVLTAINSLGVNNSTWLKEIVKTTINGDYEEFLYNPNTENGRINIETRNIFKSKGLNHNEFMNYKGEVDFDFSPSRVSIEPIKVSIVSDFKAMLNDPNIAPLFNKYMQKIKISITPDDKLIFNGKVPSRQELLNLIVSVNKFIAENSKIVENSSIYDIKDHFVQRKRALSKSVDDNNLSGKMTISLWKRDPKHDLFQGHYCQCCVSLDGCNNHSIIQSLAHVVDNIAELKNANGETVGKVKMLFLENTETGQPILLANGFEIITPYCFDNNIRAQFINFMKDYSKAVAGKEIPICTTGMSYQKINCTDLPNVSGNYTLLGRTPNNTYHLDSYMNSDQKSSHPQNLDKPHYMDLKIMYEPK